MNRSLDDDYSFSTAKEPLFNSTRICKVEKHYRQVQRCDCVGTDRNLSLKKRAVQKGSLPGLFMSWKRVMSVKGTECSELCNKFPLGALTPKRPRQG